MTGIRRLTVLSCSLDSGEQELVGAVDSTAQGLYQGGDATVQIVYVETPPSVNCLRQFREAHFDVKEQQLARSTKPRRVCTRAGTRPLRFRGLWVQSTADHLRIDFCVTQL